MALIDPQDADNSLEDCARQLDQFVRTRTANFFHVKGDDNLKSTRSVECVVFMITNGRMLTIDDSEMTSDEYGLRSMSDIDLVDFRMSSRDFRPWELQGLVPSAKVLDHVSMYRTDRSDEENSENMYRMFANLPAEVFFG